MKVMILSPHHIYMFHNVPKIVKHKWKSFSSTNVKYQGYWQLNILWENSFKSSNLKLSWKLCKVSRKKGIWYNKFSWKLWCSRLDVDQLPLSWHKIWLDQTTIFYFHRSYFPEHLLYLDFCTLTILAFWRL